MIIPFFGGVPATAAIARSSVGIKSGGQTRLVSIIHAIGLLLSMFLLAPFMARIPLAALAGVLMVTAVRMNEWDAIKFIFGKRFKTDMIAFTITMLATIVLDLTQAILLGSFLAGAVFLNKIASIDISVQEVDIDRLKQKGIETAGKCQHVRVAFLNGSALLRGNRSIQRSLFKPKRNSCPDLVHAWRVIDRHSRHRSHSPSARTTPQARRNAHVRGSPRQRAQHDGAR